MKSYTDYLVIKFPDRAGFLNITDRVQDAITRSGVQEGLVPGQCHAHHRERLHQRRRTGLHHDYERLARKTRPATPTPTTTTTTARAKTTPTPI